jgi:hypothetical protein
LSNLLAKRSLETVAQLIRVKEPFALATELGAQVAGAL